LLIHFPARLRRRLGAETRHALDLKPHHYGAHYQLAVALLGSGRRDAAQAAWREFVAMADAIGDHGSLESAPALLRISTR